MSTKRHLLDREIEIMECSAIWTLGIGFVHDLYLVKDDKDSQREEFPMEPLVPGPTRSFNRRCHYETADARGRKRARGGKYSENVRKALKEAFNGLVERVGDARLAKPSLTMKNDLMCQTHLTIVSFFLFDVFCVFLFYLKHKQEQINNWFSNERRRIVNLKPSSIE